MNCCIVWENIISLCGAIGVGASHSLSKTNAQHMQALTRRKPLCFMPSASFRLVSLTG
jgi:hypothetical protein